MPRRRKSTTTPVETPMTTEEAVATTAAVASAESGDTVVAVEAAPVAMTAAPVKLEPAAEIAAPPQDATPQTAVGRQDETGSEVPRRGRFRSWVCDTARGYSRLTDEQEQRLVLQFAQKPSADVLAALKGAGFQFVADYAGLNHVWVRRNDFETRLQVEALEKLIGSTPTRESAAR